MALTADFNRRRTQVQNTTNNGGGGQVMVVSQTNGLFAVSGDAGGALDHEVPVDLARFHVVPLDDEAPLHSAPRARRRSQV